MSVNDITQSPLVVGAGQRWTEGTQAKFLDAIRDGNLPHEAFQRWLVQDYLFVSGLTSFQAIAAASSPANQGPYADFIDRWSNEHFVAFVRELERLSRENPHIAQQGSFNEVLRHEREFWRMTWEG
jgi:thiaminase